MNTILPSNGRRIAPPLDFPVVWENPDDVNYHWTRDREHTPEPITPMFDSIVSVIAGEGRQRTIPVYEEAIVRRHDLVINTYDYTRLVPFTGTPQEMQARARRNRKKLSATALRLAEIWEREWQPEIEDHWAFWASFDLAGADLPALLAHLEETLERGTRLYELHYLLGPPMWFAIDEFETFYCDLFADATPLDAHRLLQGFDNKTLEIGRALWRLSRLAKSSLPVSRVLDELPAEEVCAALSGFQEGRTFLTVLHDFLYVYGGRSNLWDWGYPSWEDEPTPVIVNLKNYLGQPDRDLVAELNAAAAEREAAIARARRELIGYPTPILDRFEKLLTAAQTALVLSENHTYYIDFNGFGWTRRVIRQFGRRFAAEGRLTSYDDIFYLTLDELRQMAADPALDQRDLAAARRAEMACWAGYDEPLELGTRPPEATYLYSAEARRMMRYVGGLVAEASPPILEPGLLRGQAGSPGRVRGPARLIPSLNKAYRLQPGDVLVTATTAPPWTPLFLTASAVVTDAGGLLSHGAVVSREYRIPAVVGTRWATSRIADGQMVEVDGNSGVVCLL